MKILIVEDHYLFIKKAIDAIAGDTAGEDSSNPILITATANAETAQRLLLQEKWDWILMDHDLPNGWSGWILLNNAKPFIQDSKIIAMSAVPENNKRLIAHGAHFSINKMDGDFEERLISIMGL